MIEIARERVPEGRFHVGDMQVLPFDENEFDVVTAFNSLQFADDSCAALVGARRVAKPGAIVFSVVFGREERVGQVAGWRALGSLLPPSPSGSQGPMALSKPNTVNLASGRGDIVVACLGLVSSSRCRILV